MSSPDTDIFLEKLRIYLKNIRLEHNLTQAQLVKKGGNLHQSAITRLESGTSLNVGIRVLYEVAKSIGTPLWKIIKKAEESDSKVSDDDKWTPVSQKAGLLPPNKQTTIIKFAEDLLVHLK